MTADRRANRSWVRVVVAGAAAEVAAILALVAVVAVFGPNNATDAAAYAERLGRWVGPAGGAAFCFAGGWWVGRSSRGRPVVHGMSVGLVATSIDVAILLASGAPFEWLFLASDVGRVAAGMSGGWASTPTVPT